MNFSKLNAVTQQGNSAAHYFASYSALSLYYSATRVAVATQQTFLQVRSWPIKVREFDWRTRLLEKVAIRQSQTI